MSRLVTQTRILSALAMAATACTTMPPAPASESTQIVGGSPSDASEDAVVELFIQDGDGPEGRGCTGTLIAPNAVLTAYHCVGVTADGNLDCPSVSSDSVVFHEISGAFTGGAVAPSNVFVSVDRVHDPEGFRPAARGLEILDEGSNLVCSHDVAVIILDTPITTIPPLQVRGMPAVKGESLTAVGWGLDENDEPVGARMHRPGLQVLAVGNEIFNYTVDGNAPQSYGVSPGEFVTGPATCHGDSGGPMLDANQQIVGITSRGQAPCGAQPDTFTDVASHMDFVTLALSEAAKAAGDSGP
jgi:hypothetical protein